jgi:SagB-type dehydrogenase family enzyme
LTRGIGKEFMEKTQYRYMDKSDQNKGLPQPPLELPYDETRRVFNLPIPRDIEVDAVDLREAVEGRRSVRDYSDQYLSLEDLSWLLWCTQGVKKGIGRSTTLRTVPSAGARHAFETYLLVNRVEELKPGLYRFLAIDHKLLEINLEANLVDRLTKACLQQRIVKMSAVTFIWVAVAYRMTWRYSERGYRYLHLDAGHVCQNLYLAAKSIGGGVCAVGAYHDEEINELLEIDGEEQFVIYVATVGKKN